ncbi:MAG: hypothetical protein ABIY55_05930 [Kofleriaceae bacterium]
MRTHNALGAAILALALAGCPLDHASTMSASSSSSSSTPSSSGTSAGAGDEREPPPSSGMHGSIVRSQLETLRGMTPDQAREQLKKFGHDGEVKLGVVTNSGGGQTFIQACGVNKVCETSGESGISVHDDITLYLNPTLTIAPPPP